MVDVSASKNGRNRPYVRRKPALVLSKVEWADLQDAMRVLDQETLRRERTMSPESDAPVRLEDAKAIIHNEILDRAIVMSEHGPKGRVLSPKPDAAAYLRRR